MFFWSIKHEHLLSICSLSAREGCSNPCSKPRSICQALLQHCPCAQPLPTAPCKLDSAGLQYMRGLWWSSLEKADSEATVSLLESVKQRRECRPVLLQPPPKMGNFPVRHHWSHANSYCFLLWGWILWKSKTVKTSFPGQRTLPYSSKHIIVSLEESSVELQHPGLWWRHPTSPTPFPSIFS